MIDRAKMSLTAIAVLAGAVVSSVPACGGGDKSEFGDGTGTADGGDPDAPQIFGLDANPEAKPCTGLCLKQQACPNGGTTSISGTVFDPAGNVPLYNVVVYVPNAPVAPITSGATCDKCGAVSGDPLVATLTDSAGNFKLDNVPVDANVPLVMQVGKWRRQVTIPTVQACTDNALTTPALRDLTRLPKNHNEGNIPLIALTTGGADVLECWLRKVGIEDSEFTTNTGTGRVHFYAGDGNQPVTSAFDAAHGGQNFGAAKDFWASADNLKKYDIVLLSCEGDTFPIHKPQSALQAMLDYTNNGGRVFASHWHRYWFHPDAPATSVFDSVGAWGDGPDPGTPDPSNPSIHVATGTVDDSFPKGKAMKEWLTNVGASTTPGQLTIREAKDNIASVDSAKAQQWISVPAPAVEYLSFNTPQAAPDDQKCGRVVYSDLHVSSGETHGPAWPTGCTQPSLSPQEKALEFMLFDLSSCIQSDSTAPSIPPIR